MRLLFTFIFLGFFLGSRSQAVFSSISSGDWNNPSSWTLVSGTTSSNYPVAGDSAVITNGNSIAVNVNSQVKSVSIINGSSLHLNVSAVLSVLNISNELLLINASSLTVDVGSLTITGNVTINSASTITQNQGLITVLGLISLVAPSGSTTPNTGTSLIYVDGGAFSCAGGLTLTSLANATRIAELRIGGGAVNIAGLLATSTANAKINFSGTGILSIAGIVTIPFTSSFTAGLGKVIYVGIPGSNQTVAPLSYYRLAITGVGNGIKQINGSVTVADTLQLLTDTLAINAGGTLQMNNATTLVRTAGFLNNAPTFSGVVDLIYNDVTKDTTGAEMPVSTTVLRNLTINDIQGIKLGANTTVNNKLTLQNGPLFTDIFSFDISNTLGGATTDPAIDRTNGYVVGKINRAIGTSTGIRTFPLGVTAINGYRAFDIDFTTAPTAAGKLGVEHFNTSATNQSGLPLTDGAVTLINVAKMYWQADALNGLTGGTYTATLTAEGISGVTDFTSLRIIKRPSAGGAWTLNGNAGTNSGTNTAPIVVRNTMTGFSQFTIAGNAANPLPVSLLSFTGKTVNASNVIEWTTAQESNNNYFNILNSKDGINFTVIGKVKSKGNSAVAQSYSFIHSDPGKQINYYRLQQVDADDEYSFSNIIRLQNNGMSPVKIYPTITTAILTIENVTGSSIRLYNSNGQCLGSLLPGNNNISSLPAGLYFIKVDEAGFKIIKQ